MLMMLMTPIFAVARHQGLVEDPLTLHRMPLSMVPTPLPRDGWGDHPFFLFPFVIV